LKSLGDWVVLEEEAHGFADVSSAFHFCSKHDLREIAIILKFGAGLEDLSLNPPLMVTRA